MAKKRKATAAKARKTKTTSTKKKRSAVKAQRKVARTPKKTTPKRVTPKKATPKKAKSIAPKNAEAVATKKPAGQPVVKQRESFTHKIAGAFEAAVDTLVDAEELHHRLDPDPTRDPDPE